MKHACSPAAPTAFYHVVLPLQEPERRSGCRSPLSGHSQSSTARRPAVRKACHQGIQLSYHIFRARRVRDRSCRCHGSCRSCWTSCSLLGLPGRFAPVGPVGPTAPVAPVGPVAPTGPCAPCRSSRTRRTCCPVAPVGPCAPAFPAGPAAPVAPVGPVGPTAPVAPVAPTGPCAPVSPGRACRTRRSHRTLRSCRSSRTCRTCCPVAPVGPCAPCLSSWACRAYCSGCSGWTSRSYRTLRSCRSHRPCAPVGPIGPCAPSYPGNPCGPESVPVALSAPSAPASLQDLSAPSDLCSSSFHPAVRSFRRIPALASIFTAISLPYTAGITIRIIIHISLYLNLLLLIFHEYSVTGYPFTILLCCPSIFVPALFYRSIRGLDPAAAFLFSHSDPCKIFPVLSARFRSWMASFRQLVIPARFFSPIRSWHTQSWRYGIYPRYSGMINPSPRPIFRFQCLAVPEFRIRIPLSGKEPPSKITAEFRSRNSFPQTHEQKRVPHPAFPADTCKMPRACTRVYPVDVPAVRPFQISQNTPAASLYRLW